MKLLFDETLSPRLIASIEADFPGSTHVHHCNLGSADDSDIWNYGSTHDFAIVSKDSEFRGKKHFASESSESYMDPRRQLLHESLDSLLRSAKDTIRRFVEDGEETCLILSR